jgi:hypothetical protein
LKHLYPKSAGRLVLLVLILYAQFAVAQPGDAVYATETPVPGTDGGSVTNPGNAANSSKTSAAELIASKAVLGGATSCSLQLIFTNSVTYESANPKTVYFRINPNSSALANGAITITAQNSSGGSVSLTGSGYKTYYAQMVMH